MNDYRFKIWFRNDEIVTVRANNAKQAAILAQAERIKAGLTYWPIVDAERWHNEQWENVFDEV